MRFASRCAPALGALLLVALTAGLSFAQDTPAARRAAATRYMAAVPMARMMDEAFTEMSQQLPAAQRPAFIADMHAKVRVKVLEQAALDAMLKTFTADELNALADFYGSKLGQSATRKFGGYMAQVMPTIQQEIQRAMQPPPGTTMPVRPGKK